MNNSEMVLLGIIKELKEENKGLIDKLKECLTIIETYEEKRDIGMTYEEMEAQYKDYYEQ